MALHCPAYRRTYKEFLKIDFPRIPLPESTAQFDALSQLGDGLINAHLLRKQKRAGHISVSVHLIYVAGMLM